MTAGIHSAVASAVRYLFAVAGFLANASDVTSQKIIRSRTRVRTSLSAHSLSCRTPLIRFPSLLSQCLGQQLLAAVRWKLSWETWSCCVRYSCELMVRLTWFERPLYPLPGVRRRSCQASSGPFGERSPLRS